MAPAEVVTRALPGEYLAIISRCRASLQANLLDDKTWLATPGGRGVHIARKEVEEPWVATRGKLNIETSGKQVLNQILGCENRPQWDSQCARGQRVVSFDTAGHSLGNSGGARLNGADLINLEYCGVAGGLVVAGRDICLLRAWGEEADGSCWLISESVQNQEIPEKTGYVRATLRESGYWMTPAGTDECTVTYVAQTNFNGLIPPTFLNLMYRQQPLTLAKQRELLTGHAASLFDGGLLDMFL